MLAMNEIPYPKINHGFGKYMLAFLIAIPFRGRVI